MDAEGDRDDDIAKRDWSGRRSTRRGCTEELMPTALGMATACRATGRRHSRIGHRPQDRGSGFSRYPQHGAQLPAAVELEAPFAMRPGSWSAWLGHRQRVFIDLGARRRQQASSGHSQRAGCAWDTALAGLRCLVSALAPPRRLLVARAVRLRHCARWSSPRDLGHSIVGHPSGVWE